MTASGWWRSNVVYEILVPSFQDTSGDGWGDIAGIHRRLDYLSDLGVGALWLSPFYQSTLYDIGYDVVDHCAVDSRFGSMEDFRALLSAAHDRGLRVVVDFVPNHTSRDHRWFQESRRSRDDPRRDWYLWADPRPGGGPPNNWVNRFGRSAWSFDEATGQYYFGTFTAEQPDLNWRNGEVQRAMSDVLRFWLEMGIDGVRIDALPHLVKDLHFRDNPRNPTYSEDQEPSNRLSQFYSQNQPALLETLTLLRKVVDEYSDRVLIGEAYQSPEQMAAYQRAGAELLLNTSLLQIPFESLQLRNMIDHVEAVTPEDAWPSRAGGNHDIPRLANRVGRSNLRLAALLQLTVRGAVVLYYGDELGLEHVDVPQSQMRDPSGRADPRYGRDRFRVPMPWDRQPHAGFSSAEPWLPMDQATCDRNVADQRADPDSLLHFYRRVLALRAAEPDLQQGRYWPLETEDPILAFGRGDPQGGLLVAMNVSDSSATLSLAGITAEIVLSTSKRPTPELFETPLQLEPREGIVARFT